MIKQNVMTEERQYQQAVKEPLDKIYGEVKIQWYPFIGDGRNIYSPAIDVAVGPFATENKIFGEEYSKLFEKSKNFIEKLIQKHNQNVEAQEDRVSFQSIFHFNYNARCLIAIEIEKTGSRKHCIGDLVNVSALGRVGLLIAWNPKMLKVFLRQRVYLQYLDRVGKNSFKVDNVLVLTKEQFDECLA